MSNTSNNWFDFLTNNPIEGGLSELAELFVEAGYTVKKNESVLIITGENEFKCKMARGTFTFKERIVNNEEKKVTNVVRQFSHIVRFEFDDLDEVLLYFDMLQHVQERLISEYEGIVYLGWNGNVIK